MKEKGVPIDTHLSPEKANGWNHTNWWCWVDLSFQEVAEVCKRHPAPTPFRAFDDT